MNKQTELVNISASLLHEISPDIRKLLLNHKIMVAERLAIESTTYNLDPKESSITNDWDYWQLTRQ